MTSTDPKTDPKIELKLDALGLVLPTPKPALANYLPYVISGNMLHISGQGPVTAAGNPIKGQLGDTLDIAEGARAAELAGLNIVAQVKQAVEGDWSRVQRCVRLNGFVNARPDFTHHPAVINGASDLMVELFGDAGRHSRIAVGVASLPMNWAVEIDALFQIR